MIMALVFLPWVTSIKHFPSLASSLTRFMGDELGDRIATIFSATSVGKISGYKKAYVSLAAGEKIDTVLAVKVLAQPVEQGLAHTVGGGAQAAHVNDLEQARAPRPANDAHPAHCAAGAAAAAGVDGGAVSPSPPAITVMSCSPRMRRAKASRTCSTLTAAT